MQRGAEPEEEGWDHPGFLHGVPSHESSRSAGSPGTPPTGTIPRGRLLIWAKRIADCQLHTGGKGATASRAHKTHKSSDF